jgi:hypothetical protein
LGIEKGLDPIVQGGSETKFCIDRAVLLGILDETRYYGPYHNLHCIYDEEEEQAVVDP